MSGLRQDVGYAVRQFLKGRGHGIAVRVRKTK